MIIIRLQITKTSSLPDIVSAFKNKTILTWKYGFRPRIRADDWTLVISATEARDAGTYECSVNTLPKISHKVALAVKEMAMAVSFPLKYLRQVLVEL